MKLLLPIPPQYAKKISQTFQDHVNRALQNGWWFPGAPYPSAGRSTYYPGIDYMIPNGTEVYAAADGTISKVSHGDTGYGNHVRISHADNFTTIYGHLQSINVSVLNKVKAGELIGYSDNTGFSTGPHLHFELRKKDVPVDPAGYYADVPDVPADKTFEEILHSAPPFPEMPTVRVVSDYINVRDAPWGRVIGQVRFGDVLSVHGIVTTDNDTIWMKVGTSYVAQYAPDNGLMAEWIQKAPEG